MATTPFPGMVNLICFAQFGSVAATISDALGGGGNAGFMGGKHCGWPAVPHCGGAICLEMNVVPLPARAKAAYTLLPSGLTAKARGLPPNTGIVVTKVCSTVSNTSIWLRRETLMVLETWFTTQTSSSLSGFT